MHITQHPGPAGLELRLTGRLDATWADHVSTTIEAAVRAGSHQIALNFAGVDYISSLGIRVLLNHYKRLKAVNGSLSVSEPSEAARVILKAAGLAAFLLPGAGQATRAVAVAAATELTRVGATFEVYPQAAAAPLTCRVVGHPEQFTTIGYGEAECRTLTFASGTFGLGIGAFGSGFADCRDRFGEFLAAGGCAIALPTNDQGARPDYVVEEGALVPRVETLYALNGSGDFSSMVRFDATQEGPGAVGLSQLVDVLLEVTGGSAAAFVILAEAASLVGATLRRSPGNSPASLDLPVVRDWVSFTTERAGERSLALLVGVAARQVPTDAASFLRPLKMGSSIHAHVHAAQFPYKPVQRGPLPFNRTVADLLGVSMPSTVMHLMADDRPFEGVGETDLVRGACWAGPLQAITRE